MTPTKDISGQLAERYCEFLDMLLGIDEEALERRIEQEVRLLKSVRELRRDGADRAGFAKDLLKRISDAVVVDSASLAVPALPAPRIDQTAKEPKKPLLEDGMTWKEVMMRHLEKGPRRIVDVLNDLGILEESARNRAYQACKSALTHHVKLFRRLMDKRWELRPPEANGAEPSPCAM